MRLLHVRLLVVVAALCAGGAGYWLAQQLDRGGPRLASGTWLPVPKPLADFTLTDSAGHSFTRRDLAAAPTLVFFGFTHCPDVCPATLMKLAQARRRAALPQLRVLFVSVDPARDTPELVGNYVRAFDPAFIAVTGDSGSIDAVAAGFGVAVNKVPLPGGDYTMDHSAVLFLTDRQGRVDAIFTPPFDVAALATDLQRAAPQLGATS